MTGSLGLSPARPAQAPDLCCTQGSFTSLRPEPWRAGARGWPVMGGSEPTSCLLPPNKAPPKYRGRMGVGNQFSITGPWQAAVGRHGRTHQNPGPPLRLSLSGSRTLWVPAASFRGRCWSPLEAQMSSAPSLHPSPRPTSPIYSIHEVVGLALGTLHLSGPPWSVLGKADQPTDLDPAPYSGDPGVSSVAAPGEAGGWVGVGVRNPPSRPGSDLWKQRSDRPHLTLK